MSTNSLQAESSAVLLTEPEAAQRLHVSISTLRRWRRKKIGPKYFYLGGILRYRVTDLDDFVECNLRTGVA